MFQEYGVGGRVAFRPHMELRGYLASYREVDVALDPFPYGGGATSADALWMGVPVVTLLGERFEGRLTATTLRACGLDRLVCRDLEEYVQLAVELGRDPVQRERLSRDLRERVSASPLCDAARFASDMENAYRAMWRRWCAAQGTGTSGNGKAARN
jgi:predicted O-linked N-acetylglucosamine transferase (SPINDLY family)